MFRNSVLSVLIVLSGVSGILSVIRPTPVLAHADLDERIAAVTKEIAHNPQDAALYLKRGELHRFHGEWKAAAADYDRAARLDPQLAMVDLARGSMLLAAGQPRAAWTALGRFLAKQPHHAEALATRARAFVQLKQYRAAVGDFTQAIAFHSAPTPELYVERAQALAAQGDAQLDEAIRGLDDGMERLGPLVTLQLLVIDLELRRKGYDAALRRLAQVAAQSERKEKWLARRGEILVWAGRSEEAQKAFIQALAAIESLPMSRRKTKATTDLEERVHTALKELEKTGEQPR
jgi:tetratricopeptide (TPR) repeat protein